MKKIIGFVVILLTHANGYTQTDPRLHPQNIFIFQNVANNKAIEVEDNGFIGPTGSKVQQYFRYEHNGVVDGYNQKWLVIPAGTREGITVYYIINYGFMKYLQATGPLIVQNSVQSVQTAGGSLANDGDEQELWMLEPAANNGVYIIRSFSSRQVLQVPNNVNDGAAIELAPANGSANQSFNVIVYNGATGPSTALLNGFVHICPQLDNNKAINIADASTNDGATIQLFAVTNGSPNDQWQFQRTTDGYFKIVSRIGKCIDVHGTTANNNSPLESWFLSAEQEKQKWIVISLPREPGYFVIFNKISGKCIDIANFTPVDHAIIQTFGFVNQGNQKWRLIPAE